MIYVVVAMLQRLRQKAIRTATTSIVIIGVTEVFTSLPSEGRSSEFYHKCANFGALCLRNVFDAEDAHNMALKLLQMNLGPRYSEKHHRDVHVRDSSVNIKTLHFPNCIGLAAGFDKNGAAIGELLDIGFGFVEIGSVTPEPQPGNPKPRLFRLDEDFGVINRYGFNSVGSCEVEANLKKYYAYEAKNQSLFGDQSKSDATPLGWIEILVSGLYAIKDVVKRISEIDSRHTQKGLLGINLGKNKWRETLEETLEDYIHGINTLGPYSDYIVINISSPNTPGLRAMQRREPMKILLDATINARNSLTINKKGYSFSPENLPMLFVKIDPDLSLKDLKDIADVVEEVGIDGIVVSNTTNSRPDSLLSRNKCKAGGLSGKPLHVISTECIRIMFSLTGGRIPIIGVGGVASGRDVYEKLRAGACVVQLYSMLTYEGPGLITRIRSELSDIMKENGHQTVDEITGLDHDDIFWRKHEQKRRIERMKEQTKDE